MQTYLIIAALLVAAELLYFRIADRFNIIDKHTRLDELQEIKYICMQRKFNVCLWMIT